MGLRGERGSGSGSGRGGVGGGGGGGEEKGTYALKTSFGPMPRNRVQATQHSYSTSISLYIWGLSILFIHIKNTYTVITLKYIYVAVHHIIIFKYNSQKHTRNKKILFCIPLFPESPSFQL